MGTYIYFSVTFDCYYQSFVSGRAAGLSKPNFEPYQTFRFPKAGLTLNDLYDTTSLTVIHTNSLANSYKRDVKIFH